MQPGNFIINYENQLYQQWAENEFGMISTKKNEEGMEGGTDEKK